MNKMANNYVYDANMADESQRTVNSVNIKNEPMDMDLPEYNEEMPAFCPAALGLQRVGTKMPPKPPSEPVQKLNARGMPARIRKKNRFIFIDEFVNTSPQRLSPKKTPKILSRTPSKVSSPNKQRFTQKLQGNDNETQNYHKIGQIMGIPLRNLLKLPKAHRWVCFEYFYSNIDQALFDGDNDFMICLNESFPQLVDRKLTKMQWCKIRRMMGKPRRCSQAFFAEERKELEKKRKLIRYIQHNKTADVCVKDLPNEIPMHLVVGTKVTARLRKPQDGLFTGYIDAVDTSNHTYRITFERPRLGTHSVPDYEVLSNDPPDTINLTSMMQKFRPPYVIQEINNVCQPNLQQSNQQGNYAQSESVVSAPDKCYGKESQIYYFPLELIIRLSKILKVKRNKVDTLKSYNTEVERRRSYGQKLPDDFERKYAAIVMNLEDMNLDLQECINKIQTYCQQIAPGPSLAAMLDPIHLREKCLKEAHVIVKRSNSDNSVKDQTVVDIITDLTSLMLQVRNLSECEFNAYELSILQGSMEQIKSKLEPEYQRLFQNNVEIHIQRMQFGMGKSLNRLEDV